MFFVTVRPPLLRLPRAQQLCRFSTTVTLRETTQVPPKPLPYFIHRSASNNLPVYEETKAGGSKKQTRIRKLEGNIEVLRHTLIEGLQLEPGKIYINNRTKHIIIKGHIKKQVTEFLHGLNF